MSTLVVVCGATGGQGGSVIATLLNEKEYRLRAVTRNANSQAAKKLAAKGVEVVTGDLNDQESLIRAFKDANIIFGVTNFFEPFATLGLAAAEEIEHKQGCNIALAAAATPSLRHFLWSTLPYSTELSGGRFSLEHYNGKARVDKMIKEKLPELLEKTTFLWLTLFTETMRYPMFVPINVEKSSKYIWLQPVPPTVQFPSMGDHHTNTGPWVLTVIRKPELTQRGKYVFVQNEALSLGKMLQIIGEVTGNETEYIQVTPQVYDNLWPGFGNLLARNLDLCEWMKDGKWFGPGKWEGLEQPQVLTGLDLGILPGSLPGFRDGVVNYFPKVEVNGA